MTNSGSSKDILLLSQLAIAGMCVLFLGTFTAYKVSTLPPAVALPVTQAKPSGSSSSGNWFTDLFSQTSTAGSTPVTSRATTSELSLRSATGNLSSEPSSIGSKLALARQSHRTNLKIQHSAREKIDLPFPGSMYKIVTYTSQAGDLSAYLATPPGLGNKRPAVIWITGGDCNTIGDVWSPDRNGRQSTEYLIDRGIVVMFPSLRGGNQNPGYQENMYGEVNDIIAAHQYLTQLPDIDPDRIYLAGHSTGGTLVLLTSEVTNKFRAVFSFGPVSRILDYDAPGGPFPLVFDRSDSNEAKLRSPIEWLESISTPTFVIEGDKAGQGNASSLREMAKAPSSPFVRFVETPSYDHFSILTPACRMLAQKILMDVGPTCQISIDKNDLR